MPRKPTPKKAKPAKPDFVFPPGGAAIAAVPGLRLKPRTGDVPRWWPVDKPGKAAFACNVPGVAWNKRHDKWYVENISAETNKRKSLGLVADFGDACVLRAAATDGKTAKGDLVVVDGQLCITKCAHHCCRRTNIPATEFAPDVYLYKKDFGKYVNALEMLVQGLTDKARVDIDKLRVVRCLRCRDTERKSYLQGEHNEHHKCRLVIEDEIKAHWVSQGGCRVCGCCDPDVLSGDHEDRQGKEYHEQWLNPSWWACHGGAQALREHYLGPDTTVQCLCMFCHAVAASHGINFSVDSEDLCVASGGEKHREHRHVKRMHVNAEKLRRGKCEHPLCCDTRTGEPRIVTADTCHGFHMAHKNEVEKEFGIAEMVNGTLSAKSSIPKLNKEMAKCYMYCANCHKKYDTLPRLKEGRELLDALLARGAPVCGVCE